MRNNLKRIISLMLVVLCVASFSVTAFAAEGGEVDTTTSIETNTDTETTVTDETKLLQRMRPRQTLKFRSITPSTTTAISLSQSKVQPTLRKSLLPVLS